MIPKSVKPLIAAVVACCCILGTVQVAHCKDDKQAKFLQYWSNLELWNKLKYKEWIVRRERAIEALSKEYSQRQGWTPLMYAAAFSGFPVIRYLLDHGADKNAKASDGSIAKTYLHQNKVISAQERRELLKAMSG